MRGIYYQEVRYPAILSPRLTFYFNCFLYFHEHVHTPRTADTRRRSRYVVIVLLMIHLIIKYHLAGERRSLRRLVPAGVVVAALTLANAIAAM